MILPLFLCRLGTHHKACHVREVKPMSLESDIQSIRSMLEATYEHYWAMSVAADDPSDSGVPPEMQVGEVNEDGWVEWKLLDSKISLRDVTNLENEFQIQFPDYYRAYLLSACHLFDEVVSEKYDQQIMMPAISSAAPLSETRQSLQAWSELIHAGFIPIGQWGDGWGPICFDTTKRNEGDCPLVWMDHELIIPLGESMRDRERLEPFIQPLWANSHEFLEDLFG